MDISVLWKAWYFLSSFGTFSVSRRLIYIKLVNYWPILDPPEFSCIMSLSSTSTYCSSYSLSIASCGYFAYRVINHHIEHIRHILIVISFQPSEAGLFYALLTHTEFCYDYSWDKGCVTPLCLHLSIVLLSVKKESVILWTSHCYQFFSIHNVTCKYSSMIILYNNFGTTM